MRSLRRKTLLFAFLAAMLMCVFTILLSFSFAEDGDTREARILPSSNSGYVSNIDLIIENSHDGVVDASGKDLSKFYIVEVGSKNYSFTGDDVSPLYKMLVGDIGSSNVNIIDENASKPMSTFSRYVIDMHSSKYESLKTFDSIETLIGDSRLTNDDIMVNDKIVYTYYCVSGIDENACVTDLAIADLVYLSDPPSSPFDDSYDLPESIKIQLSSVASSKFVPFIIDDYTKAGHSSGTNKNFSTLKTQIFKQYGSQRYTVDMLNTIDIDKYLNRKSGDSLYLPINKTNTDNWDASTTGGDKDTANFLVIRNGSADNNIYSKFVSAQAGLDITSGQVDPTNPNIVTYPVDPTGPLYMYGYTGSTRPNFIKFETIDLGGDSSVLNSVAFDKYDLILLEKGVGGVTLSDDLFNSFASLVFANAHIIYDSAMADGSSGSDDTVNVPANYKYVYDKVATSNGKSRFSNVLVSTYDKMNIYASAITAAGVQDIVDILKGGSYRGNGGKDNLSNTFNVLEIQPAYPIDVKLAEYLHKGNFESVTPNYAKRSGSTVSGQAPEKDEWYYIRTDAVSSETSDAISFDGVQSLTAMMFNDTTMSSTVTSNNFDNVTDYYAWELSNAKIAHVTGRPIDSVNVTHMSALEFNTNRDTLKDTFDMIYIGGNDSALRFGHTYYKLGNGYMVGNDFSDIRLEDLEEYLKSGLPVVLSNDLITNNSKVIDPDTNVYKFITECFGYAFSGDPTNGFTGNVLCGFDPTDTVIIPNDGAYGQTYGGMVTVLNGLATQVFQYDSTNNAFSVETVAPDEQPDNGYALKLLLDNTKTRPKFILTEHPVLYQEGNTATNINNSQGLKFVYKITDGGNYEPHLYVDDDHNSIFDPETEEFDVTYDEATNTVTCELPSDSYGGLYWKFTLSEIKDASDPDETVYLETAVTGISKIVADEKGTVNLLQLVSKKGFGKNGKDTLFFCTDCQECMQAIKGVRYTNEGKYDTTAAFQSANFDDHSFSGSMGGLPNLSSPVGNTIANKDSHYTYEGNRLGVHIHNFGIVKYENDHKIGNEVGLDNWETNWADEIRDDYDFNTKILTMEDFDKQVKNGIAAHNGAPDVTVYNNADKDEMINKVYSYIGQNYMTYYQTFANYYIDGKFYSSNGRYYNIQNGSAREMNVSAGGSDEDKNNASAVDVIVQKLCSGYSLYDQYIDDIENGSLDNYSGDVTISVRNAANPNGDISETELKRLFDYCEYNKDDIGITVNDMNKYVVAQYNIDQFLKGYRSFIERNPSYQLEHSTRHDLLLDEIDFELKYHRYGDFFSVTMFGNSGLQNTTAPSFTFNKAAISNTGVYSANNSVTVSSAANFKTTFAGLYQDWRDAKIIEQYLRDYYIEYMLNSGYKDGSIDLTKCYSCMVIGAGENMADDDLKSNDSLTAVKNYIKDGGHTILFHDTITNAGTAPRLTSLRAKFGLELGADPNADDGSGEQQQDDPNKEYRGNVPISIRSIDYEGNVLKSANIDLCATEVYVDIDATNGSFRSDGSKITISSNAASNAGNYRKHDIKIVYRVSNLPDWWNSGLGYVKIGGNASQVFNNGDETEFSSSILEDSASSGGGDTSNDGLTQFGYSRNWDLVRAEYMNKFANCLRSDTMVDCYDTDFDHALFYQKTFTNKATRVNKGVVTAYPFMIDNNLQIAGTHPGEFAADIYNQDMVVWYTLDGGSQGSLSSPAAADPHNGADNYYMYSFKNVMYCGAGHSNVTGKRINNNDERRLFINAIINGAGPSFRGPSITVYDYVGPENDNKPNQTYRNDTITPDGSDYKMTVNSTTSSPNFTYRAQTDSSQQIAEVKIYFDLTPDPVAGADKFKYVANTDKLIYNMKYSASGSDEAKSIANKLYKSINNTVAGAGGGSLQLSPNYFIYEGNSTAYLIIAVKTSNDRYAFKRIKIKLTPKMYDLT